MEAFRFYSWIWLLALPALLGFTIWQIQKRKKWAVIYSSLGDLRRLPVTLAQRLHRCLPWLYSLGLCLVILALARPQSGKSESLIMGDGIAIELVLDTSASMDAIDFEREGREVNRLEAVKHVIKQFVLGSRQIGLSGRKQDLMGLVAFGGFADSKCPLTLDHGGLVQIVEELNTPKPVRDRRGNIINEAAFREESATAIGDGIALGVDRLRDCKAKSKVLVLLTDGDNNAGAVEPLEAAAIAKELGIKIYSIGIGRDGVVPVPQEDAFGQTVLVPAQFRIDEKLLKEVARITDGRYFHASDTTGLSEVYSQIDALEKSKFEETQYAQYTELYRWFAAPGLSLILLVGILKNTRFRSLP